MKFTSLLELVNKLQQAGKIDNLQQACGVFGCVLERCVLNHIWEHLQEIINDHQHGFMPGRSCTSQLVGVLDKIGKSLTEESKLTSYNTWT